MNPEGSAPPPPPAEVKAPAPEANKPAVENPANGSQSAEQPQAADKLSDGSSLNDIAEKFDKGEVDLDAEFKKFADSGESIPNDPGAVVDGKLPDAPAEPSNQDKATPQVAEALNQEAQAPAQTPDGTPNPAVENPQPPVPEQQAGQPTPDTASEGHDLEAQQARIDDMMKKKPDELQRLADEGNIHAKKALSDIQKQSEQVQKDWKDWEGQAQYKEPSAAERANGAQVEPKSEAVPPAEATPSVDTPEAAAQAVLDQEKSGKEQSEAEDPATEKKVDEAIKMHDLMKKMEELDIKFLDNKNAKDYVAEMLKNPEHIDNALAMVNMAEKQAKEFAAMMKEKTGVDINQKELMLKNLNGATEQYINKMMQDFEKTGVKLNEQTGEVIIPEGTDPAVAEEMKKKGIFLKILKALGKVLTTVAIASAGAAVGAVTGAAAGAAAAVGSANSSSN